MKLGLGIGVNKTKRLLNNLNPLFKSTVLQYNFNLIGLKAYDSINSNHSNLTSGITKGLTGKLNKAWQGSSSGLSMITPDNGNNYFTDVTHFSVRFWFKTTQTSAGFFFALPVTTTGQDLGLFINNGQMIALVNGGSSNVKFGSASDFNDDVWHRAVFNFPISSNTADFELYVDGVLQTITQQPNITGLGVPTNGNISFFEDLSNDFQNEGLIDSFSLDTNKNFTQQEVNEDYNAGAGVAYIDNITPTYNGTYDIYLVAGQSNASGRDQITNLTTQDYIDRFTGTVVDGVDVFDGTETLNTYDLGLVGQLNTGREYQNSNIGGANKVSPDSICLSKLNDVRANRSLACIVTEGGTGLEDTWKPSLPNSHAELLVNRAKALMAYLDYVGIPYNIKAVLWHQGERDQVLGNEASYAQNFADLWSYVRTELGDANLPIIYGTVSSSSSAYSLIIRNAHLDFATNDANAYCRDNNDLTLFDGLHFDADSTGVFGEWMAQTIINNSI